VTGELLPVPSGEVLAYAGVPKDNLGGVIGRLVVLLAQRYGLDPALKHVEVIPRGGGLQPYITADGWRFIADRSGELDGITFADVSRGGSGWRATTLVWKKGCGHPFEGRAGAGDNEKLDDPEAMAMTRATRRALRNAFAASIVPEVERLAVVVEVDDEEPGAGAAALDPAPEDAPPSEGTATPAAAVGSDPPPASSPSPYPPDVNPHELQRAAREAFNGMTSAERDEFTRRHGITDLGVPWPDEALDEILGRPF
jgi:hypothetical protein